MPAETRFVEGPALSPASELLAWFEGEGSDRLVRLPVVVTPSPLGVGKGKVGYQPGPPDALEVELDDTAMSASLADRIHDDCPADEPCAIWVEGVWGATVQSGPGLVGPGSGGHAFSVRRYAGKVEGKPEHVQVARD